MTECAGFVRVGAIAENGRRTAEKSCIDSNAWPKFDKFSNWNWMEFVDTRVVVKCWYEKQRKRHENTHLLYAATSNDPPSIAKSRLSPISMNLVSRRPKVLSASIRIAMNLFGHAFSSRSHRDAFFGSCADNCRRRCLSAMYYSSECKNLIRIWNSCMRRGTTEMNWTHSLDDVSE